MLIAFPHIKAEMNAIMTTQTVNDVCVINSVLSGWINWYIFGERRLNPGFQWKFPLFLLRHYVWVHKRPLLYEDEDSFFSMNLQNKTPLENCRRWPLFLKYYIVSKYWMEVLFSRRHRARPSRFGASRRPYAWGHIAARSALVLVSHKSVTHNNIENYKLFAEIYN